MRVRKNVCRKTQGAAEPGNSCLTTPGTCESCPDWVRDVGLEFTVPLVPPSVNHYVKHTRSGRHYVTPEGRAFKKAVGLFVAGRSVGARRYKLEATVFLGHGQRGDGDNFWKVIADGLVEAGAIHSDAAVDDWILHKRRDRKNPRTVIQVSAAERTQGSEQ